MVRGSWIKPGAVAIDVGINPVEVRMALLMMVLFFFNHALIFIPSSLCLFLCVYACGWVNRK